MKNVNENTDQKLKLIKHFIKDLSFENPQNINENNSINNNNNDLIVNMNVLFEPYKDNFFSLVLKYDFDCSSKNSGKKLFNLELDYFGLFKILDNNLHDQKTLVENGLTFIFPFAKKIIEDISKKGGSIVLSLDKIDFNLIKH